MQTGKLDQRITVTRANVTGQTSTGEDVFGTPTTIGTFWANVDYLQGRELAAAIQRWAEARYNITIRRQPGVTLKLNDTLTWGAQTLDMLDIRGPGTRDDFWIILAKDFKE